MHWVKAAAVGFLGSLIIFLVMILGVKVTGFAPFNLPPSAAFLEALGLNIGPLAIIGHFAYGIVWAWILLALFGRGVNVANGLGVAGVQWLLLMLVYAPIIGWGFFGIGGPAHALAPDEALHLGNPVKFLVLTLVLHAVYGGLNGWLIPRWIGAARSGQAARSAG
ncbi:MAG TPA: hypothetical protein VKA55_08245 [Gammaproteobacteria bacterium]|nr:hypothetical protein [Gammaproteobacteria bacterium]